MVRKLESFAEEAAQAEADDRELRSRSDARRSRVASEQQLERLARDLVALSPRRLDALELPENLRDAVDGAQLIKSAIARNRQLRIVRRELRDLDHAGLKRRLDELLVHGSSTSVGPMEDEEARWLQRLLTEGHDAVEALLLEHEQADRKHLRQLLRAAQKAAPGSPRRKAEQRLLRTLSGLLAR